MDLMEEIKAKYAPLNIKKIVIGTRIDTAIYYIYNNELVMLCENVTVTGTIMGTFLTVKSTHGDLYIDKNLYKELQKVEEKPEFKSQDDEAYFKDLKEISKEYDVNLKKAKRLYDYARDTSEVDIDLVEGMVTSIMNMIHNHREDALFICASQLREVESYLYTHAVNVAIMNGLMGKWIAVDEENIERLVTIGILHDIGKTQIPSAILNKPGRYTVEEYEIMKKHSIFSYELVKKSSIKDLNILHGLRSHHERVNGTGYPDGLVGDSIPFFGRVTAICDVYDAMITSRCYQKAVSPFMVLDEFTKERYSDLDIKYVNLFLQTANNLLIGRDVILSDGRQATVALTRPEAYRYPIVAIGPEIFITNDKIFVREMYEPVMDMA